MYFSAGTYIGHAGAINTGNDPEIDNTSLSDFRFDTKTTFIFF